MKTTHITLIFIVFAFLFAACGVASEPTATAAPTVAPTPTTDPTPMAEAYLEAMNAGDMAALGTLLADDAVFTLNVRILRHQQAEPIEGKDAILGFLQGETWGGVQVVGKDYESEGGRVLFNCRFVSAGGVLLGNGSKTSNSACVIRVENGLITFVGDQANEILIFGE